jgi:hypothetical protein
MGKENGFILFLMPAIKDLFKASWVTFKASLLNLFLLSLINIFVQGAILIVFGVIAFILLVIGGVMVGLSADSAAKILTSLPLVAGLSVAGIVYLLVVMIVGAAFTGATILAVARAEEKIGLGEIIKAGFGRALPLIFANFVLSFLIIGALVPFIFPVIVVNIFLFPVLYEVILEKKKILEAIRFSVGMVKMHFGDIFVRGLALFGLSLLVGLPIYFPQMMMENNAGWSILMVVPNTLLGWFGMAYMINLYKQARAVTPAETTAKTWWLWAMAGFGWVVLVLTIIGVGFGLAANWGEIAKNLTSYNKDKAEVEQLQENLEIPETVPSWEN